LSDGPFARGLHPPADEMDIDSYYWPTVHDYPAVQQHVSVQQQPIMQHQAAAASAQWFTPAATSTNGTLGLDVFPAAHGAVPALSRTNGVAGTVSGLQSTANGIPSTANGVSSRANGVAEPDSAMPETG